MLGSLKQAVLMWVCGFALSDEIKKSSLEGFLIGLDSARLTESFLEVVEDLQEGRTRTFFFRWRRAAVQVSAPDALAEMKALVEAIGRAQG